MGLLDRIAKKPPPSGPPDSIDVNERHEVVITWPGGPQVIVPPLALRDACPCAECIEEGTGRKVLDPASIPADIRPLSIEGVGNYAVQIRWSDGHSTGIYTWQTLREVCGLGLGPGG
ncbi:MAG TPA: DUF971 domain-containing protein [Anaeromyxobacteraceae bacterium]|nr:DUF971 domain-containing protein [Anaeromyxobacteraceae bacterium]